MKRPAIALRWVEGTQQLTDPLTKRNGQGDLLRAALRHGKFAIVEEARTMQMRKDERDRRLAKRVKTCQLLELPEDHVDVYYSLSAKMQNTLTRKRRDRRDKAGFDDLEVFELDFTGESQDIAEGVDQPEEVDDEFYGPEYAKRLNKILGVNRTK